MSKMDGYTHVQDTHRFGTQTHVKIANAEFSTKRLNLEKKALPN